MALTEEQLGSLNARLHVTLWSVGQYADSDDMTILRDVQKVLMSSDMVSKETLDELTVQGAADHHRSILWANQARELEGVISEMLDRWRDSVGEPRDPLMYSDILARLSTSHLKLREELKRV